MNETFCKDCAHFLPDPGDDTGECRRYPKQLAVMDGEMVACVFPDMRELDWCGEWQCIVTDLPKGAA